jgi:hypothetical protein
MAMFRLADRLHKTIGEIERMPLIEIVETIAFYKLTER